jgi:hypothetical protein
MFRVALLPLPDTEVVGVDEEEVEVSVLPGDVAEVEVSVLPGEDAEELVVDVVERGVVEEVDVVEVVAVVFVVANAR